MESATVEKRNGAAIPLAQITAAANEAKLLTEELVGAGKRKAQKLIKRGFESGEDCLDESRYYIKHNPWQSVTVAAGVGVALGLFAGWMFGRACRS